MTKYGRQIVSARKTITRKGTTCTWYKAGLPVDPDDPTPEFQEVADQAQFPDTPIVYYPQKRLNQATNQYEYVMLGDTTQRFGLIPGDVPFTPEAGDAVKYSDDELMHVDTVNTTAPDGTPIVHEVSFK
jgi:hypothetical protein